MPKWKKYLNAPEYLVDPITGCWVWQRSLTKKGYGVKCVGGCRELSLRYAAHRYYYTIHKGVIPPGMTVDHMCDNKKCVNPEHLQLLTNGNNNRRRFKKYRHWFKSIVKDGE